MNNKTIVPAKRISTVEEYYFSRKLKEVAEMNARGLDVINLGVGSPDLPPSPVAISKFCDEIQRPDVHGYQPYIGIAALREGFAEWYQRWYGVTLDPAREIQPLIGSKEGILHISMAFLNVGDGVLVPNPGYPTYTSVSQLVGASIVPYTLVPERGWKPDFEALEATVAARYDAGLPPIKLMWTNYPNMPTGADASKELFAALVDFGRRHGIVICNDNPYSFILNDLPQSILAIEGAKDVCIELNSMSKAHNMPGWRMAMLASNAQFVQWILRVKSNIDSGQFRPMQSAVVEALKADKSWYDAMNDVYRRRRVLAGKLMDAFNCTYDPAQVGLFLWGRIPDGVASSEELADSTLYDYKIFITPGSIFGSAGNRYVRISLCCKENILEKALYRVKKQQ
ncbi:MAG: aminotransferase class I/II-fold pyridoxal phosphate-dependent enzyme [Tannerella sp.]|jgi:aspartate/methionine/tyrosine aminotransferase|nr:aminotransferase class I/II-fold pyridoxal phosphate-dependent enzyme [Tannerella sp.]